MKLFRQNKFFIEIALLVILFSPFVLCQAQTKVLRWGADAESGAPYAFHDPSNPETLIGFEVEIVDALAHELNMKPEFVQNHWDGLVPGLQAGNYDVIINGLEITEDRKAQINFSNPYYFTYEQLTVRKTTFDINSLEDCKNKVVGTLEGSLAQKILQQQPEIEIKTYADEINAYGDLINGRLEAVLLDAPIELYYARSNEKLKKVGGPIGHMEYGIGIQKNNPQLLAKINESLDHLIESGKMRSILERWALWNSMTEKSWRTNGDPKLQASNRSNYSPVAYSQFLKATGQEHTWRDRARQYLGFFPVLARGALMTLEISILSMIIAVSLGLLVALMRLYGPMVLSLLAVSFIEIWRGTPLLIQLYLIFYGLPHIGIKFSPFFAAIIGLGLNYAASEAENYRAGILSIPSTQRDAAAALGMSHFQTLFHVVIPQAFRLVIPPMTNDFIALLKDSSLVSVITLVELSTIYGQLASTYFDYLGIGLVVAAVYFLIGLPFVRLSRWAEMKYGKASSLVRR